MLVALLEIDYFLPVVHCCFFIFTDVVPLISGRGLKFCACIISRLGPASAAYIIAATVVNPHLARTDFEFCVNQ